jgi:hypothetical protein
MQAGEPAGGGAFIEATGSSTVLHAQRSVTYCTRHALQEGSSGVAAPLVVATTWHADGSFDVTVADASGAWRKTGTGAACVAPGSRARALCVCAGAE